MCYFFLLSVTECLEENGFFVCEENEHLCLPQALVCDRHDDCGDGSDEVGCSKCSRIATFKIFIQYFRISNTLDYSVHKWQNSLNYFPVYSPEICNETEITRERIDLGQLVVSPPKFAPIVQGESNTPVTIPSSATVRLEVVGNDITILKVRVFVQNAAAVKITPKDSSDGEVITDQVLVKAYITYKSFLCEYIESPSYFSSFTCSLILLFKCK